MSWTGMANPCMPNIRARMLPAVSTVVARNRTIAAATDMNVTPMLAAYLVCKNRVLDFSHSGRMRRHA